MVEILESSFVVPSEPTPSGPIWLSNLDLLVARSHTPTVYFYRRPDGVDTVSFFAVDPLKSALARSLVQFYPLAGRLGADPAGRVEIRCTGEGVLFVVGRSEMNVDDFGDFEPSDEMRRLLVPSAESDDPPLVMFQVTFFKCGGVCLGTAIHHTAADGLAALHFINTWSDFARGITTISTPPCLDHTLLRARSPPSVPFDHPEYSPKQPATMKPQFTSTHLKLSKNQIKHLKSNPNNPNKPLSTFKAVVAHTWRSACIARSLAPDEQTRLLMTADARTRMQPPLPPGFLGNAIFRTSAVATAGDISSKTIEFGADKITEATRKLDDAFVRSLIDYLETVDEVKGLQKGKWVMPRGDMWVISWLGLPIYEADFGWGRPIFMGRACLQFSGLVYVMGDPNEIGGIVLAVALEPENMEEFKRVFYEDLGGFLE
nr:hydroxycinnamoyltransferase 2 [Crinum x powellii]